MKQIVFHGTSIQNAKRILKEGFLPKNRNWKVSNSLAYFYNYPTYRVGFETALIQGGSAAFKYVTECRRAVIALSLDDSEISPDATNTAGKYAFQFNGKVLTPNKIVGCWHDTHNLQLVRPFILYNSRHQIHRTHTPKLNHDIAGFFKQISDPIHVPVTQIFSKVDLGFDPTNEKFLL